MVTIGITGIMGSGKSLVSGMFELLGAKIIDADEIVHRLLCSGTSAHDSLVSIFGEGVLREDGSIDRSLLAGKVFGGEPENIRLLNAVLHPEVIKEIDEKILYYREAGVPAVVVDAPLLIETGLHENLDYTIVVRSTADKAVERITGDGRLSAEDFSSRMKFQLSGEEKEKHADFIIDNNGPYEATNAQVKELWKKMTANESGGLRE